MKKEMFNKKNILIIVAILVIICLTVLVIVFPFNKKEEDTLDNTNPVAEEIEGKDVSSKDDLLDVLTNVGKNYYEREYYTLLTDKEVLSNFTEFGLKISLAKVNLIFPFSKGLNESLDKYKCDVNASKIIIYPESPYKVKDYKIKLQLSCEK